MDGAACAAVCLLSWNPTCMVLARHLDRATDGRVWTGADCIGPLSSGAAVVHLQPRVVAIASYTCSLSPAVSHGRRVGACVGRPSPGTTDREISEE